MSNQVTIVNASAGSGKTHALAEQYIRLLLNPPHPEISGDQALREILAITFTNKAALQMKERVLEFLKKIALDNFSGEYNKYREKALLMMDAILKKYHFFRIETIDSFIKSILSGCTFRMDFSSGFSIKEDYSENLAYSLDRLIDKTGKDRDVLDAFARFLDQYLYIENRANWFLKRDILSVMGAMFYSSNIYGDRFRKPTHSTPLRVDTERRFLPRSEGQCLTPSNVSNIKGRDLIIKKREALKGIKKLKDTLPDGTNQSFVKSLTNFLDKAGESFDIDSIPASFGRPDFPLNKGHALPQKAEKLWVEIKKNLEQVCELESLSLFNPYIDIFDMVIDTFRDLAIRDDTVFLEELNRCAREFLNRSSITIGELYYRLATRFRHYLIDEFQDTSVLQWRNLNVLIEEALSTGGTLFCVGDRKQAIYRFRGGDVSLLDYAEEKFKRFNVEHKTLNMNFRSHREIVEFNNEIFSEKNLKRFLHALHRPAPYDEGFSPLEADDIIRAFQDSRQSYRKENDRGYVRIEHVDVRDKEERENLIKEKIISLIAGLTKRLSYEDIAILVRDRDEVELATGWLLENGIPVESANTLNIKEHPCIKELISFLTFLNSPIDNLSFSSFLLGDIFIQASGLNREQIRSFLFQIQRQDKGAVYFYTEFRRKYPDIWAKLIERFFKSVGFIPLYEFTVDILAGFDVMKRFSEYQGFFMRFLELIKGQEDVNANIPLFLDFFDGLEGPDLYVDIVDSRYVKVLTIHKSKGLEFPIVIIPFLSMDIRIGAGGNSGIYRRATGFTVYPGDRGLEIRRLKAGYGIFSERLHALYKEEYKKSFIDELNNIYVAFTRARDELYIFIPEKSVGKNFARLLIPADAAAIEFGRQVDYKSRDQKRGDSLASRAPGSHVVKIPASEYRDWIPYLENEFKDLLKLKNRYSLKKGEALHYILSFIGNLSPGERDVIEYAMQKASSSFPFVKDLKKFGGVIRKIVRDKDLKKFFFIEDGVVYQEKEIIDLSGQTSRIDRLIVKENTVEIIDYKSSKDEMESSRKQMQRYIKAVRNMYPGKDVRGYLVFLDEVRVEEVYGKGRNV